jgi:CRISPR-associated protein Cas1
VVLQLVNTGVVAESDFVVHTTGVALRPHARKRVIVAFERRLDQEITHPVFGYRISYRRVLEVQSRLFARLVLGEIEQYPEFRTR